MTACFVAANKNTNNAQIALTSTSSWRGTAHFVQNNTTIIPETSRIDWRGYFRNVSNWLGALWTFDSGLTAKTSWLMKSLFLKRFELTGYTVNVWFWPNGWNILTDEGVIPETSRIDWIEHFLMNILYIQLLSYLAILDELRVSCHAGRRRPIFGAKIDAWKHKMVHIFHFLPISLVFEIESPLDI